MARFLKVVIFLSALTPLICSAKMQVLLVSPFAEPISLSRDAYHVERIGKNPPAFLPDPRIRDAFLGRYPAMQPLRQKWDSLAKDEFWLQLKQDSPERVHGRYPGLELKLLRRMKKEQP